MAVSFLSTRLFKAIAILGAIVSSSLSLETASLAQPIQHFYVANLTPPDILERQGDAWWRVALSGIGQRRWVVCCQTASQDPEFAFRTPSNNIHCLASTVVADGGYLRCDLKIIESQRLATKEPCKLEAGDAFAILANGKMGEVVCHGDTVIQEGSPVLQYGQVWRELGFTCQSSQAGLTCSNAEKHGFFLSRTTQRVF
jgi:hypothetical protein